MNNEDWVEEANTALLLQATLGGEARLLQRTRSRVLHNILVRNRMRFQPREFPSPIVICLALLTGFFPIILTWFIHSGSFPMDDMYFAPLFFIFAMNLIFVPIASVILFLRRQYHEVCI